jgi:GT2 family glycosyltransferase
VTIPPARPTASVVVITLSRPDFLAKCLRHIEAQTVAPKEVIVVDASPDESTYNLVVGEFPTVRYIRNPLGPGTMGASRNLGLAASTGDVVVFVDDDAYADDRWLELLLEPYADPGVGGVGGRASRDIAGEEHFGVDEIGLLRPDGTLTGNFAADPGHIVEVDHFLGANMSYRRSVLEGLGGIRDGYPGTCLREDTDLSLRVKLSGWKLVYVPDAWVLHVAAPYVRGSRFDLRYQYYGQRNHVVLLARIFGPGSRQFRRYVVVGARIVVGELAKALRFVPDVEARGIRTAVKSAGGHIMRASMMGAGLAVGIQAGIRLARSERTLGRDRKSARR